MVSVVVPAYNSQKTIKGLLDSLCVQDFKEPYEIIVVDDGSTDSTALIASEYTNIRLIKQVNAGPAAARNKGVSLAKGEIILFTDSDCEVFPDWISQMVLPFRQDPQVIGVKGAYRTRQKEVIARFVQLEYEDKYDKMKKEKYIDFIDTYSAGFKKDIFLNAGGYDTSFPVACSEDIELSYQLSAKGYKMVFNPDAIVFHQHPNTLRSYLKKKFKFAYWRVKAVSKNPDKIIKDSHTPFVMKLQIIVLLAIILSLPFIMLFSRITLFLLAIYIIMSLPFTAKAIRKDAVVGILSPGLLFLRSIAQLFGLARGSIKEKAGLC